jgi:hypothetical protein
LDCAESSMDVINMSRNKILEWTGSNAGPKQPVSIDDLGGGGDDGGMEPRIAKLEAGQEFIQRDIKDLKDDVRAIRGDVNGIRTTDFRLLFGAIIAVAVGLAGLMARGFHWI